MDVIYCAGGNSRLARIAIGEGFLYGARSDDIRHLRCDGLIDINWKRYDWHRYLDAVDAHRPRYAVVPDILHAGGVDRAIEQAEQIQQYCGKPIVVPKVHGVVDRIPNRHVIGVSVPTSYAGFLPDVAELHGRSVHLLGGSPRQQRDLWKYYTYMGIAVLSLDINCHSKASDFGSYWNGSRWCDDERHCIGKYEAFRKSCRGILTMWRRLGAL